MSDPKTEPRVEEQGGGSDELITVRRFSELLDASLAKATLESAGLDSFIKDEYTIGHVVQVNLQVRQVDVEAAEAILDQPIPESFEVEGVGSFQQPRCPECGCLDVDSEEWITNRDSVSTLTRSPGEPNVWKCKACQHKWMEGSTEL